MARSGACPGTVPWRTSGSTLSVHGVRFPYRLEKWVSFHADGTLRVDYRLTNLSRFDFDFMWAAHMMLNLEDGAT